MPSAAPNLDTPTTSTSSTPYSALVQKIKPLVPKPEIKKKVEEEKEEELKDPNLVEVTPPPISLQPLIDKTASYVAKNGADMMPVVRKTHPEKFAFLHPENQYNNFFLYKVSLYTEMLAEEKKKKQSRNGGSSSEKKKFPQLKGFFR